MKAIILAGGFGTRLHPLTLYRPKHMLPIVDKPLIRHVVDYIVNNRITEIWISINGDILFESIEKYFSENEVKAKIYFIKEKEKLGGVGAIKYALELSGINETFALVLGDNMTNIKIKDMLALHEKNPAVATLALVETEMPWFYGVAKVKGNNITDFVEKPKRGAEPSNLISTGIYIMEPKILDYVPTNFLDSTGMLFPLILKNGGRINGFKSENFWIDVGNRKSYLKAVNDVLRKKWTSNEKPMIWTAECKELNPDANYLGDFVVIHKNCKIGDNVQIKNSVIFSNVTLGDSACIENSIIDEYAVIGKNAQIINSIIGANAKIEEGTKVFDVAEKSYEKNGNA